MNPKLMQYDSISKKGLQYPNAKSEELTKTLLIKSEGSLAFGKPTQVGLIG